MTTAYDFLADILAHPDDDTPRLVFADWLEEQGDPRSEFIRVQCRLESSPYVCPCDPSGRMTGGGNCGCPWCSDRRREGELIQANAPRWFSLHGLDAVAVWDHPPTIRWFPSGDQEADWIIGGEANRGFVVEVTCKTSTWMGERCPGCDGDGQLHADEPGYPQTCLDCHGRGRLPGIGARLIRAAPLTRVVLSGVCLWNAGNHRWGWTRDPADFPNAPWWLPRSLFAQLQGGRRSITSEDCLWWGTEQAALDALQCRAALAWARLAAEQEDVWAEVTRLAAEHPEHQGYGRDCDLCARVNTLRARLRELDALVGDRPSLALRSP